MPMKDELIELTIGNILANIDDWTGEAGQAAQHEQDSAVWFDVMNEHLGGLLGELWDKAYDSGWMASAGAAIEVCNRRASPEEKPEPFRNEAAKCALQIEHELDRIRDVRRHVPAPAYFDVPK